MNLRHKAILGVKWTGSSALLVNVLDFLCIATLTRLLSPKDFGLMSMLTVVMGFCYAFTDMGMSNAVIQKKEVTPQQLSSLFWINIASGFVLSVLLLMAAPLVVAFYRQPLLEPLLKIILLNFLFIPLGQLPQSLLQKELRFKELSLIDITVSITSLFTSIFLALNHFGVLSFIYSMLLSSLLRSILLLCAVRNLWAPTLHFRASDVRGFIKFGLYQIGEKTTNYLYANMDYLFVGRFLGPDILGIYTLAYQLVVMPFVKLNPILTKVAFPVFSVEQNNNQALSRGYMEMIKLICLLVFPIVMSIAVLAPVMIPLIFGAKWSGAIVIIQILAIMGIIKALCNPIGSILLAKGRVDIGFKFNLVVGAINTLIFYFAAQKGLMTVSACWVVLITLYFMIIYNYILPETIGEKPKRYFSVIYEFLTLNLITGIAMIIAMSLTTVFIQNMAVVLGLTIILGILTYLSLLFILKKEYTLHILNILGFSK